MATKYELVVIFDPFLNEEEYAAETERVLDQIKKRGGNPTNTEVWGKKRLAYLINKKIEGYYVLISFEGDIDNAAMTELERNLRLSEKNMRHMITRIPEIKTTRKKEKKVKAEGERRAVATESYSAGHAGAAATSDRFE